MSERDPEMAERIRAQYNKWNMSTPDDEPRTCTELIGDICAAEVRRALVEELGNLELRSTGCAGTKPYEDNGRLRTLLNGRLRELRDSDDEEWTRNKVAAALDEGGQPKPYSELRGETEHQGLVQLGSTGDCGSPDAGSSPAPLTTLRGVPHKCPPRWEAYIEGWGDPEDPHAVYAHDADDAAKDHFESQDDEPGEYFTSEHVVCVRRSASEPWQRFSVRREAVVEYHATALDGAEVRE